MLYNFLIKYELKKNKVSKYSTLLWANINAIQQNKYYMYVLIYIKIISNEIVKYLRIARDIIELGVIWSKNIVSVF